MSYSINDNTYTTLKRVEVYDIFSRTRTKYDRGTDIDSVNAFGIIVKEGDQSGFEDLTPQECIDRKVALGYIELKS